MKKNGLRGLVEIGFIVFLFYSNLLMGEFERSGAGRKNGLLWALSDVFTAPNIAIALVAAVIGYVVVEFLRQGTDRVEKVRSNSSSRAPSAL